MDLPRPSLRIGAKHPYMRNEALHDIFNALRLTAMSIKLFMSAGLANNLRVSLSCRLTDLGRGPHTRPPLFPLHSHRTAARSSHPSAPNNSSPSYPPQTP